MIKTLVVTLLCAVTFTGTLSSAQTANVLLRTVDANNEVIPARLHILDSQQNPYPAGPQTLLYSHTYGSNVFFYSWGIVQMVLPIGETEITIGRGFEFRPQRFIADIQNDTLITVTLDRVSDLAARGWFGADDHLHTQHLPREYDIDPINMRMIARAEDLDLVNCLDMDFEFTGGLHPLSDNEAALYYTFEYRDQACGHAAMLGLKELTSWGCCNNENSVYPLLTDFHATWNPDWDEALVLVHPHTTFDFFFDSDWPGYGLGRELPVMAALGALDAMEIASANNDPNLYLDDWYHLLNCGLQIAPAAGTDAVTCRYYSCPPGGYRTYVKGAESGRFDHQLWVENLKAGNSFITNYPLIPRFEVAGYPAGTTLIVSGQTTLDLRVEIQSALPLQSAWIVKNGCDSQLINLPATPEGTTIDTTLQVDIDSSCWLAVRVMGVTDIPHAMVPTLWAHTAPVYVNLSGQSVRNTASAAYFLDWIDTLEDFAEIRGNWPGEVYHQQVLQRFDEARAVYQNLFIEAPSLFALRSPMDGATLLEGDPAMFEWSAAVDGEAGDQVRYRIEVSADSLMQQLVFEQNTEETTLEFTPAFTPDLDYWWRVIAFDRGGNETLCTPSQLHFFLQAIDYSDVTDEIMRGAEFSHWPNPTTGTVWFEAPAAAATPHRIEIYDLTGRPVARREFSATSATSATSASWDGRDDRGRPVPSGYYQIRLLKTATADEEIASRSVLIVR